MTAEEAVPSTTTAEVDKEGEIPTKRGRRVALILTVVAGFVNTMAFARFGTTCSHMSGHIASFSRGTLNQDGAALMSWAVASFFFGGIIFAILKERGGKNLLQATLLVEAALLFAALAMQERALCLMAIAMGVQNGYTSSIKGLRTTHITGILTDIGHDIVIILNDLRKHRASLRKDLRTFYVHVSIPVCFVAGGALGVPCFQRLDLNALLVPTLVTLALAATRHQEE
jgi:uncharacterized membrane protein YoaK (UPF0700 family)